MSSKRSNTQIIVECAILIAMGTILAQIKLFRMPNGGSVTAASMVPFLLISYRHGTKWGFYAGIANVVLQIAIGGIYPPIAPGFVPYILEVLLDYFLAYMCLGLAHVLSKPFKKRISGILMSTFIICVIRFMCAFLSGFLVWGSLTGDGLSAVAYSLGYNAAYMVPETVITCLVMGLLYGTAPKLFI